MRLASAHHNPKLRGCFPLILAAVMTLSFLLMGGRKAHAAQAPSAHRTPVLVELFTSEGCSDCPPADALLARLDATQFVPGAKAIVLSEHVTYWNHQGWSDPFSLESLDERQKQYAWRFSLPQVYTPQMVVDGEWQFVGSDTASLRRDVARAALTPKVSLVIADVHWSKREVYFSVRGQAISHTSLTAVLAESWATSDVTRGENAGHTLENVAVVRALKTFSSAAEGRPLHLTLPEQSRATGGQGPLRLIVFLTRRKDRHVIAVAEQTLSR